MMATRIDELRERRNTAAAEAEDILGRGELTEEEINQATARMDMAESLDREIEALVRADKIRARLDEPRPEPDQRNSNPPDPRRGRTDYELTFRKYLRGGTRALDQRQLSILQTGMADLNDEQRALAAGTGTAGGYTVPEGFRATITETMKQFGGMRQVANVISTDSGNSIPWPLNNDTGNVGALLAENTQMSELDVAFTTKSLGAYMYVSGLVRVSYQLMNDSGFDLEAWLGRKLGERIGRIQNTHFTTGTGSGQPQGLVTGATSALTAASATAVTLAELQTLKRSVDPAYRDGGNARWMMNDTTAGEIAALADADGRPLWQPDLTGADQDRLLGYPVVINQDMPNTATGLKPIAFGDFRRGYTIRDVQGIQVTRLDERYADYLQVGFFANARSDGLVDDAAAFKVITMA